MVHFKGCPRCHGDLHLKHDMEGLYLSCLQCGFTKDLPKVPARKPEREPETAGSKSDK
jgi:hypothetical protein